MAENPISLLEREVAQARMGGSSNIKELQSERDTSLQGQVAPSSQLPGGGAELGLEMAGSFLPRPFNIPGAGAGAGFGRLLRLRQQAQQQGKPFSIRQAVPEALQAGGMAAGAEAVVPALIRRGAPFVKRFGKKVIKPGVESALEFFTDIPQKATSRAIDRGPSKIFTRAIRSEEYGANQARQLLQEAREAVTASGERWKQVVEPLRNNPSNRVDISSVSQHLDKRFAPDPTLQTVGGKNTRTIRGVQDDLQQILADTGGDVPLDTAFSIRQELDDLAFEGVSQGLISTAEKAKIRMLRKTLNDSIQTAYPSIKDVDNSYSSLRETIDFLGKKDPSNPQHVAEIQAKLDKFYHQPVSIREGFTAVKKKTGEALGRPGTMEPTLDRAASLEFQPTKLRGIRGNMIGSILGATGLGGAIGGWEGAGLGTLTGVALSTPRGAGAVLQAGEKLGQAGKAMTPFATQGLQRGVSATGKSAVPFGGQVSDEESLQRRRRVFGPRTE